MAKLDKDSDEFLLGTIAATVTGTAEDVKAIRLDVGSLSSRITAVENRVEAIETSRETLVPQYTNFKHDTNNELQKLNAWKHEKEGLMKGASMSAKVFWAVGGAVLGLLLTIGGNAAFHSGKQTAKQELTVERTITVPKR